MSSFSVQVCLKTCLISHVSQRNKFGWKKTRPKNGLLPFNQSELPWIQNMTCGWLQYGPSMHCRQTKPRYSLSADRPPKASSSPHLLPGFSIISSNWLLHMAVLSCDMIRRVDLVEPWLRSRWIPDTQNKHSGDVCSSEKQFEVFDNLPKQWPGICESFFVVTMALLISLPVSENFSSINACQLSQILFILNQNIHTCWYMTSA